jgi:2,4-dienoyl-CoA reductase (NADPH2)
VQTIAGVSYERIDDDGLHILVEGELRLVPADTIVICAGQDSERGLRAEIAALAPELPVHVIGGADVAEELDAMRAIDQATRLAVAL